MRMLVSGDVIGNVLRSADDPTGAFASNKTYTLARIHLLKVGCPRELSASAENRMNVPLVVARNRKKLGLIEATGYYPEIVVVAGGSRRAGAMAAGRLAEWGWIESGVEIQDDDVISCGELMASLQKQIVGRMYERQTTMQGQPWPNIVEVYPFENSMIYACAGQKYRQAFSIGGDRNVQLSGMPVRIDACGGMGMPKVQTGVTQTSIPLPLASNQVSSRGGPNSELMTQVVRDFSNVNNAVAALLSAIKNGIYTPLKPAFAPVPLTADHHILRPLAAAGISSADFAVWAETVNARDFSDKERKGLAKRGVALPDGSFPIKNTDDLGNAVKAFGRAKDQAKAKAHIIKRARALGATHMLPDAWKIASVKSEFNKFNNKKKHDTGDPKRGAFHAAAIGY